MVDLYLSVHFTNFSLYYEYEISFVSSEMQVGIFCLEIPFLLSSVAFCLVSALRLVLLGERDQSHGFHICENSAL